MRPSHWVHGGRSLGHSLAVTQSCASVQAIVSSAFETNVALEAYAHLAAAFDAHACSQGLAPIAHGLGTSQWFAAQPDSQFFQAANRSLDSGSTALGNAYSTGARELQSVGAPDQTSAPNRDQEGPLGSTCSSVFTLAGSYTLRAVYFPSAPDVTSQQHDSLRNTQQKVLLLHGFLGKAEDWEPVARGLSAAGLECIALDLPGHGGSTHSAPLPPSASGES